MKKIKNNKEKNYIELNSTLNKIESDLFENLIDSIKYGQYEIIITKEELNSKYKLDQDNDWFNFFMNFSKKYFIYKITKMNVEKMGIIRIISSFSLSDNEFIIKISQDLISIFNDTYNDFKLAKFDNQLLFKNKYTFNLYTYLYDNHILDHMVEIDMNFLKNLLALEKSYTRFYDFEKYVLKKALKEIKKYKNISIEYLKIKKKHKKNIAGINFFIKNKLDSFIEIPALKMLEQIEISENKKEYMLNYLKKEITLHGKKYVENNFKYALLHNENILNSIKYDYYHTFFNNKMNTLGKHIYFKERVFDNKEEMILTCIKESKKLNEKMLTLMINIVEYMISNFEMYPYSRGENKLFDNILLFIKENNKLIYKDENYAIIAEYNKKLKSRFAIFKI